MCVDACASQRLFAAARLGRQSKSAQKTGEVVQLIRACFIVVRVAAAGSFAGLRVNVRPKSENVEICALLAARDVLLQRFLRARQAACSSAV